MQTDSTNVFERMSRSQELNELKNSAMIGCNEFIHKVSVYPPIINHSSEVGFGGGRGSSSSRDPQTSLTWATLTSSTSRGVPRLV